MFSFSSSKLCLEVPTSKNQLPRLEFIDLLSRFGIKTLNRYN